MFRWARYINMKRSCLKCEEPRASGNPYCKVHHNEQMREWRKTHRLEGEARKRSNARSYLHVYIKRGKIVKQPCEVCGNPKVLAKHVDYDRPLDVRWLCKEHHRKV